jgi:hypothetical protein
MLRFNMLLREASIDPSSVRLLRHYPMLSNGVVLVDQFHRDRTSLLAWQSVQSIQRRPYLAAPVWASFLGTPDGRTIFEGLYSVGRPVTLSEPTVDPLEGETIRGGSCDHYDLALITEFEPYSGRLMVDWGGGASGKRAWVQRADNQDKAITAVLENAFEQPFPGYLAFQHAVGALNRLSPGWVDQLRRARGVYLLSCPATGRLYTGSATGLDGFWGRWQNYLLTGHGGNQGLVDCDTRTFAVSILQVAGSTTTAEDIVADEQLWKAKLLSREFGYNRN